MTLEELSVVFTADAAPFIQAVSAVEGASFQAVHAADSLADAFYQAGARAAQGLGQGILSHRETVAEAARTLAQAAADAMRSALQIHSPSRVTREMGLMFDRGFLEGILQEMPMAEQQSRALATRAAAALEENTPAAAHAQACAPAAAPVHVTLPLEIDGYRLGMAVLENINRIMDATGRVELNL